MTVAILTKRVGIVAEEDFDTLKVVLHKSAYVSIRSHMSAYVSIGL
jgi:hypothetical protein